MKGRPTVPIELRKISLTLSVPHYIWKRAQEFGRKPIVEAIDLGLWAKEENINTFSLIALKDSFTDKLTKLQKEIEKRNTILEKHNLIKELQDTLGRKE